MVRVVSPLRHQLEIENEVNNEMANRMSLFYAEPMPMMKTLSKATTTFVMEVKCLFPPPSHIHPAFSSFLSPSVE